MTKLEAGRELDARVHVEVMDLEVVTDEDRKRGFFYMDHIPRYSANMAAAWPVAEKLALEPTVMGMYKKLQVAVTARVYAGGDAAAKIEGQPWVAGETVPHAICLAALKAMEAK